MKQTFLLFLISISILSCTNNEDLSAATSANPTFTFSHNWDNETVTNDDFNTIQYTTQNGDILSIERLRYVISDITFTTTAGENLMLGEYNLVDLTNTNGLSYTTINRVPIGTYANVSFTFGFDNEDNAKNYLDLNSESFNVPDMLGGGYHYMQFDGKYLDNNATEQGFNYHAIRAVDNPGANPTFPQDTYFTVNLGQITITNNVEIEVKANLAEWFRNPHVWDLNVLNQTLMPNSSAQIMMFDNGQTVFSLGDVIQ
ncbi:MbnP family protein [uncultured Winogradskyella sp.]|uniref:MbnP family protein n=1 Tax=uncultured Winogradskyella sp. TaxID=395353 RepID=UPI0030D72953|tara:strand:+ start:219735 stop:220505 length:771 start_codon:yes stop_codon:yes gene_type:complete